jgi:hypothetical protein
MKRVAHGSKMAMDIVSIGMSKITAWKGGRSERIEARISPEAKSALLARVDREGFRSFADWLEAQAMPHLTPLAPDSGYAPAKKVKLNRKAGSV